MYNLPYFKDRDTKEIIQFLKDHPFAMLIGSSNNVPSATQVPLLVEERRERVVLSGHIMRQTDHHRAFLKNNNVLCVFTGAHSYISASWYTDPKQASTWNYMSVHVRGKLKFIGEEELHNILRKTSLLFEGNNSDSPTIVDNLDPSYVERLSKAIVGFEIDAVSVEHVFKLSQNRDRKSYRNIIEKLSSGDAGNRAVAEEMQKREDQLFSGA